VACVRGAGGADPRLDPGEIVADESASTAEPLVAGSNDRYSCITASQPGCDFAVGVGQSLFGAGECRSGVDFDVSSSDSARTRPLVLAIHGGGIEDGTAQFADHLRAQLGWDAYVFRARATGAGCQDTQWMHVTSNRFNSATARALAQSHPSAVSLHGYSESNPDRAWARTRHVICVGGENASARAAFIRSINTQPLTVAGRTVQALDATDADNRTSTPCGGLQGTGRSNVVNLPPQAGIQLEMPRRIRAGLAGLDGHAADPALFRRITAAIDSAL
jgi:phage replication-related protein YjqB (UPF0714/DUF867 family)